jgi:membrane-bound serine protease (ClpP class)
MNVPKIRIKRSMMLGLLALVAGLGLSLAQEPRTPDPEVVVLAIDGAIGPATRDYVVRNVEQAEQEGAELVVLQMDTPGGLDASMRDMIKTILNAEVPVATWVGPPGARAASAGTYLLYASHIAAMAPSTNLGAATPVQIGGGGGDNGGDSEAEPTSSPIERARDALTGADQADEANDSAGSDGSQAGGDDADLAESENPEPSTPGSATERKAVEDAVAYIRGLADRHGRNADWAEKAVREAASLTAQDATEMNVIDLVAEDLPSLLDAIDGREIRLASETVTLTTDGARIAQREPDWRSELLGVITNPTLAYILMMVGIYGLILEGYNPGALVPGVIGGISLLLALYSFQILPVNYAGLALMVLGFALIAVELFVPSFGILGIGGVVAVVFGSVILMDTEVPGMAINSGMIGAMGLASALLFLAIVYLAARSHRNPRVSGTESLVGQSAEAIDDFQDGTGRVHIEGEDWSARSRVPVSRRETVEIVAVDGLVLEVQPLAQPIGDPTA